MKRLIRLLVSMFVPAFIMAGVVAQPVMAQDKAKDAKAMPKDAKDAKAAPKDMKDAKADKPTFTQKVLHEDDKVRVTESTFKPGNTGPNVVRGFRVTRAIKGGTMERTWADGKKEKIEWKTGEVRAQGPDKQAFWNKNVGKSEVVLYTVNVKQAK